MNIPHELFYIKQQNISVRMANWKLHTPFSVLDKWRTKPCSDRHSNNTINKMHIIQRNISQQKTMSGGKGETSFQVTREHAKEQKPQEHVFWTWSCKHIKQQWSKRPIKLKKKPCYLDSWNSPLNNSCDKEKNKSKIVKYLQDMGNFKRLQWSWSAETKAVSSQMYLIMPSGYWTKPKLHQAFHAPYVW